jgi:hypothetical protein
MCFEIFFAECQKKHSAKLPSVKKTLDKPLGTRQRADSGSERIVRYKDRIDTY